MRTSWWEGKGGYGLFRSWIDALASSLSCEICRHRVPYLSASAVRRYVGLHASARYSLKVYLHTEIEVARSSQGIAWDKQYENSSQGQRSRSNVTNFQPLLAFTMRNRLFLPSYIDLRPVVIFCGQTDRHTPPKQYLLAHYSWRAANYQASSASTSVVLNLVHCWDPLKATDVVWDPQVKIEKSMRSGIKYIVNVANNE